MSAHIHSVTAADFITMTVRERTDFLASVASEFLTTTGRGANKRPDVALPESYTILFNRRVRQAAKLRKDPEGKTKATPEEIAAEKEMVIRNAAAKAEKAAAAEAKAEAKAAAKSTRKRTAAA